MKIIYFLFLLSLIPIGTSATLLDDANTTDVFVYTNDTFVDTLYSIDPTDSFTAFEYYYESIKAPHFHILTFQDNQNNELKIKTEIKYNSFYYIFDTLELNYTASLNGIPLKIKDGLYDNSPGYVFTQRISVFNPIWYTDIHFISDGVMIRIGNRIPLNQTDIHYYNKAIIETDDNANSRSIKITYLDSRISEAKAHIEYTKGKFNLVFNIIFSLFQGFLGLLNFTTLISDTTVLQWQTYVLEPLQLIDSFIGIVLLMIRFIVTKGLFWFVAIMEMLFLIFSFGKNKNEKKQLTGTLESFVSYNTSFFTIIGKLLNWIYENLFLRIVELIKH